MTSRPRLLDLFCGAGGAAVGYHRAGFDVEGVDIVAQPRYPFLCNPIDALKVMDSWLDARDYRDEQLPWDAIHASPPCQRYSDLARRNGNSNSHPDLIDPIRRRLERWGGPYVIENVEGAPLIGGKTIMLCGTMFPELSVIRHRLFETNFLGHGTPLPHPRHPLVYTRDKRKAHYGRLDEATSYVSVNGGGNCSVRRAREAMGIDWMTKDELNEAIPPAYTEWIGRQLLKVVR